MSMLVRRYVTAARAEAIALSAVLFLCGGTVWAAALTWTANSESDLAGYRVYSCSLLPCSRSTGTATMMATLGRVNSFDIGAPPSVQHYVITAYDVSNNESRESDVATYVPSGAPPPPSAPFNLRLGASMN